MKARFTPPPPPPAALPQWVQAIADKLPPLLTVEETAAVLRVSRSSIRAWIKAGTLRAVRNVPGMGASRALVPATSIVEWLLSRASQ